MELKDFLELNQHLVHKRVVASFTGIALYDMANNFNFHAASLYPENLYKCIVELGNNINSYSSEKNLIKDKEIGNGMIVLYDDGNLYRVVSGNIASISAAPAAVDSIMKANTYIRKNSGFEDKGFHRLAALTGSEIKFELKPLLGEHNYLLIEITVKN
ncbi:MAG: DUF6272 family protein [Bacteroidota bacterium]